MPNPPRKGIIKNLNRNSESLCFRIYIHTIRRSDGSGGQTQENINESISILTNDFSPLNISFQWDGIIRDINNTQLYNNPNPSVYNINNFTDGINIYMFGNDIGGIGNANVAGFSPEIMVGGRFENPSYNNHGLKQVLFLTKWVIY